MTESVTGSRLKSLRTLTLRDKKWLYKGEGNANVVLAMPEDGTVLRVMKNHGGDGETSTAEMLKTLSLRLDYCDAVRRLFFGGDCDYVDVPVPMCVSTEELFEIDRRLRQDRPADRKHKGLEWSGGLVAVYWDYTVLPKSTAAAPGPVFCAEIKPKQGWLHDADRTATLGGSVEGKCAFCAHQYLKSYGGARDVRGISRYCPLDLFSGRRERVELAARNLFRTPQNNLKIFRDGVPLVDDGFGFSTAEAFGDDDRFARFVAAALLGDFDGGADGATVSPEDVSSFQRARTEEKRCDFDAVPMPQHCVLHKILAMQKMQTAGFAAVCSEYERLPKSAPQFGHVERLLSATVADKEIALNPVDGYLVAATARDCSVFVTFRPTNNNDDGDCVEQHHTVQFDGVRYAVRVKVSDLDPKPLSTIDKHRKRNADVLRACDRYMGRPRD